MIQQFLDDSSWEKAPNNFEIAVKSSLLDTQCFLQISVIGRMLTSLKRIKHNIFFNSELSSKHWLS
jgi:hypothetical protein